MEYRVSKIKELVSAVEAEIELTRNKLAELEQVLETVRKYDEGIEGIKKIYGVETKTVDLPVRRRLKNSRFSDIETMQIINMWNKLSQLSNLSQGDVIGKIANTMKQPKSRIHNKIYWLARTGRIKNKYALLQPHLQSVTDTKVHGIFATEGRYRKKLFRWTPEITKKLIELSNAKKTPSEISRMTGIDTKVISNKLNRLRRSGILPKVMYKVNPLANL